MSLWPMSIRFVKITVIRNVYARAGQNSSSDSSLRCSYIKLTQRFLAKQKETLASMFRSVGGVERIKRSFCLRSFCFSSTISIPLLLEGPETSLPRSNVDPGENVIGSEGAILHERFEETDFRVYSALID